MSPYVPLHGAICPSISYICIYIYIPGSRKYPFTFYVHLYIYIDTDPVRGFWERGPDWGMEAGIRVCADPEAGGVGSGVGSWVKACG